MPLVWRYLTPHAYETLDPSASPRPAAAVVHGDYDPPDRPWLQIHSTLPPVDGAPRVEVMLTASSAAMARSGCFDFLETPEFLIVASRADEAEAASLTARSDRLYDALFPLIEARGYPHILRLWNIIEDINRVEGDLERYRQFCLGRHEAYVRRQPGLSDQFPAASAVGSRAGGLTLYGIAAKAPGLPVENPNQVSAYRYPPQYGPRSPSFSRALVKEWSESGRANLFISGTASITGHETRHAGNIPAQVGQTIDNLETVAAEASRRTSRNFALRNPDTLLKAYVRRPEDLPEIRACVLNRLGPDVEVLYLRSDVCREALLVEIDGVLTG
jgi:chorismate lyase/3-hydroxybenzoate synthase